MSSVELRASGRPGGRPFWACSNLAKPAVDRGVDLTQSQRSLCALCTSGRPGGRVA